MKKYTEKEIENIRKWRGEGLTWNEISDRNGRSPKAMSLKFSNMTLGVPEYKAPEIPSVVIPENVKSLNERKAVTVKRRIPKDYAVKVDIIVKYDTLEDAAALIKDINKLVEVSQYYSGAINLFETNEIEL